MNRGAVHPSAPGIVLGLSLALFGCGGEGGGSSVGGSTPPTVDLVEITSANAKTVAGAAVLSSLEGGSFGSFALSVPVPDLTTTKTSQLYAKVGAIQGAQAESLVKQSQAGYMQAAVGPEITQCAAGGTATVTGDVASEQTLTAGDNLTIEFADCDDGTAVVDGSLSMTITSFSGSLDNGQFEMGVTLQLTAFTVVEGGATVSANGDVTLTLDALSSPVLTTTVSSSSLAVSGGGASHELSDFSLSQTTDTVSGEYSIDTAGTLESSAFDGAATFEVTEPFAGTGAAYPGSGELLVTGAGGATIRATVLDTTFVRLAVDTDGDGTVDEIVDATWDELT